MANIDFFAWNCGGLRASAASQKKAIFFENNFKAFDIFFFLETHHRALSEIQPEILRYSATHHIIHSPVANDETHAGIVGLISRKFNITRI